MARRQTRIVWSARAVEDLHEVVGYLRQHSPRSARRIAHQIRAATRRLARFPLSGRMVPEFETATLREIIVRDYRIIYRPIEGQVEVLTVVHGSRDLTALPPP